MKVTVGIPAYNEEKNIAKIIVELKKTVDQIIVCDDGSTDSTSIISLFRYPSYGSRSLPSCANAAAKSSFESACAISCISK